jgi:amino acid transporter
MTRQPVPAAPVGATLAPIARLEPDAITAAQDTFIGAALVGPTVSVALTLAALAAATAYAAPVTLLLTAVPVLVIANAYRRLNLWNASCGASFERVGRAISPYLGFITGWLMITGTLIGTLSPVVAVGPNILAVAGGPSGNKVDNAVVATVVAVFMLIISVIGIRLSARTQVAIGVIEYALLVVISVAGLPGCWVITRVPSRSPGPGSACTGSGGRGRWRAGS